ncbi:MAG: Uroporphyrinogen decarboxylase [Chlamydiae bacterium]|nr:Uroporphyrinogen decarboxylase [Chlamydiota bacterium]
MDDLLLKALRCEKTHRPPVWLMRQAGRYMKEYRDLKEKYSFLELCRNSELATEITLMPVRRFGPDAAIMFADILLILETFGFSLRFGQDQGPLIDTRNLLADPLSIKPSPVEDSLSYVAQTIKNLKKELKVPLLGFCGAPFTLATYVLEGRSSKDFKLTKQWLYQKPDLFHHLLDLLTEQTILYLKMQIKAGIDAIQIFDSWAGFFPYSEVQQFSLPYLKRIIQALKPSGVPIILFAKGSCAFVEDLAHLNPSAISLDSSGDLLKAIHRISSKISLQGNLDPDLLQAPLPTIRKEVMRLCMGMKDRPGYVFNLGHGIKPHTPLEAVECLIDTVKEVSYL